MAPDPAIASELNAVLSRQRAAQLRDGTPSAAVRADRLGRCVGLLVDRRRDIEEALNADFGARSRQATAFGDIASSIGPLKHARKHVAAWMRTERRTPTPRLLGWLGGKAEIRWQPKGVVGLISPWNFPVNLTFAPLAGVLAAQR
jgi:coniferyl-aldehyde dehydrogenase